MGIFDIFKSTPKPPARRDITWISTEAKWKGLLKLVEECPNCTVLAWFPVTLEKANQVFQRSGIQKDVKLCRAFTSSDDDKIIFILEHYPFLEKEEFFLSALVNAGKSVTFLNSLDEPLFLKFGGEKIKTLMGKLGLEDSESVEHAFISNSILNIQKKIQEKVTLDFTSNSAEDWIHRIS
jgi:hypothetical protein